VETITIKNNVFTRPIHLDNAGKLYPFIDPKKRTSLFSLTVTMKEKVNNKLLQKALNQTIVKFPSFNVKLKNGFFWHYLMSNEKVATIKRGYLNENMFINKKENNEFLFKVLYSRKTISLIVFHALTDGAGAMVFLKSLLNEYISLCGQNVFTTESIPKYKDRAEHISECEDSFKKFYKDWKSGLKSKSRAYHFDGIKEEKGRINTIIGTLKVDDLLKVTRENNVSITTYLTALYLYVLQSIQIHENKGVLKPIRIQVPVNLRSMYPSKTLRNFTSFVVPELKAKIGEYTFDEVLKEVDSYFKLEMNKRKLTAQFSDNVRAENNPIIKRMPRFIKKPIMLYVSHQLGAKSQSGTLSNLGRIVLPKYIEEHVEKYEPMLLPGKTIRNSCALASYKGKVHIIFARTIKESTLENMFFSKLTEKGLNIKIQVN